ncbi:MAG: MlaD family protein [Planctomycetota bacterium]|jgi:hypothetical protein
MATTERSGLLWMGGLAVLVLASLLVVVGNPFGKVIRIKASVSSLEGISTTTPVMHKGAPVGRVTAFAPLEAGGILTLSLDESITLPVDSQVQIQPQKDGACRVDLIPGTAKEILEANSTTLLSERPRPAPLPRPAPEPEPAPELEPELNDILSRADRMVREARRDGAPAAPSANGSRITLQPSTEKPEADHGK